jgi:hypothetical protein
MCEWFWISGGKIKTADNQQERLLLSYKENGESSETIRQIPLDKQKGMI